MPAAVVIVDYDPRWPVLFHEEKARLRGAIGHIVVGIEHIGSTAVPGLAAKPIIDIMVGVERLADAQGCIGPLQGLGWEYVPEHEVEFPERRYFNKGPSEGRTHHLHMLEVDSYHWERHLLFRDFLRAHPEVAQRYDRLKRELAARFSSDREAYTLAKTEFIESVVAEALRDRATR